MQNPKSSQENEKHKVLCKFEIQSDRLISAKWLDLVIANKKREPTK